LPEEAESEATMLKVMFFWEFVGLTGEKVPMGFTVPLAGGQAVIPGSQMLVQLYDGVSPVTLVWRLMGDVAEALQITWGERGEDWTTGTGLTLKVKPVAETGEQPLEAGMILKTTGSGMFPELARFCRMLPVPEMVEGTGVMVAALPDAVHVKVVDVSVPATEEESATWASEPEQMVRGDGTAGTTLGMA
jgi:hypothetical protein